MKDKPCKHIDTFDIRITGFLIITILWFCQPASTMAQSFEAFTIPKLNGPITLDGHVDEPAWQEIDPLPLISHWPSFGYDASEGTELRIAYVEEYLYVSCICYEEPGRISAPTIIWR